MSDLERDLRVGSRISLGEWVCLLSALVLGTVCGGLVFGIS